MSTDESELGRVASQDPNLNVFDIIGGTAMDVSLIGQDTQMPVKPTPKPLPHCSIGLHLQKECEMSFIGKADISPLDQKLIKLRTGVQSVQSVCTEHYSQFIKRFESRQKKCSFVGCKKKSLTSELRGISYEMYSTYRKCFPSEPCLVPGKLLCNTCRIVCLKKIEVEKGKRANLAKQFENYTEPRDPGSPPVSDSETEDGSTVSQSASNSESNSDDFFPTPPEIHRENLKKALAVHNLSPPDPKKLQNKGYALQKTKELQDAIKKTALGAGTSKEAVVNKDSEDFTEMITQLQKKFHSTKSVTEKFTILSILPQSWSHVKVMETFQCSKYLVSIVKDKVKTDGILCKPNPKVGKKLDANVEKKVIETYLEEHNSRILPGKRDCKTVKIDGVRVQMQKRLLLMTVGELYAVFKEAHPNMQISLSKFAELRPPYVVLAGAAGTHTVCVCPTHQNVKLMIQCAKLEDGADGVSGIRSFEDCFSLMLCDSRTDDCYFGNCMECPKIEVLQEKLQLIFDLNMVENIQYKEWVSVDRANLNTLEQEADDFIDTFIERLKKLAEHDFITRKQAAFLSERKKHLQEGEVFVVGDFSMNYKPVIQNAIQSYHWTNAQITLHPFVCYYPSCTDPEKIVISSYIMVSDYLNHDTSAVYAFQRRLIEKLKEENPTIKKLFYSSDGAASQYKNKFNVANLCHHLQDFGIEAEWDFSASAHGKGPSDSAGGTAKRLAYKESLRKTFEGHILTAADLTDFINKKIEKITAVLVPESEIQDLVDKILSVRFKNAQPLKGITTYHSIVPVTSNAVIVKRYSTSKNQERIQLMPEEPTSVQNLQGGFATALEDNNWCLVRIESVDENTSMLNCLKFAPQRTRFKAENPDTINLKLEDLLLLVTPSFDGYTYGLSNEMRRLTDEKVMAKGLRSPILSSNKNRKRRRQNT
ncbi:ARL14 effector protein [Frankliniella fusca]|uniref:ARL14 effector protein n=1 Tax=Frankliniella fusca TaxID=407009 RepID=A0AAE1HGD1_9NEOP|nr:ARL14 effector protein [Frankliniella fusca]